MYEQLYPSLRSGIQSAVIFFDIPDGPFRWDDWETREHRYVVPAAAQWLESSDTRTAGAAISGGKYWEM